MTLEEAEKIGDIISYVDGGCEYCVGNICNGLNKAFPDFGWEYGGQLSPGQAMVTVTKREDENGRLE